MSMTAERNEISSGAIVGLFFDYHAVISSMNSSLRLWNPSEASHRTTTQKVELGF